MSDGHPSAQARDAAGDDVQGSQAPAGLQMLGAPDALICTDEGCELPLAVSDEATDAQ